MGEWAGQITQIGEWAELIMLIGEWAWLITQIGEWAGQIGEWANVSVRVEENVASDNLCGPHSHWSTHL